MKRDYPHDDLSTASPTQLSFWLLGMRDLGAQARWAPRTRGLGWGRGALGSRLVKRVFQQSLSLTLTSWTLGVYLGLLLSIFWTLAKFWKLGQHWTKLVSILPLWTVSGHDGLALLAQRDNIPKFNLQFCQEQEHSDNGEKVMLISAQSCQSHSTLDTIWLLPALRPHNQGNVLFPWWLLPLPFNHSRVSRTSYTIQFLLKHEAEQISRCKMAVKLWDFCHKA